MKKVSVRTINTSNTPYSKILKIENQASFFTEKELRQLFETYGCIEKIEMNSSSTFIFFDKKQNAEETRKNLNGNALKKKITKRNTRTTRVG